MITFLYTVILALNVIIFLITMVSLAALCQLHCPRHRHHVQILHESTDANSAELCQGKLIGVCIRSIQKLHEGTARIRPDDMEPAAAQLLKRGAKKRWR